MSYERPTFEFWDLEEEGIVVTSLGNGGDNGEGGDGDFDGSDVEW